MDERFSGIDETAAGHVRLNMTSEQLRNVGLDPAGAQRLQDFYANRSMLIPSNQTAPVRVELLQRVLDALGGRA